MADKLTDTEVKKALECCVKDDILEANNNACLECPMNDDNACTFNLRKQTLDLINRLEFKNCQLEKQVSEIQNANLIDFKRTIGNYIAENESLKAEVERLQDRIDRYNIQVANQQEQIEKYEPIKETLCTLWETMLSIGMAKNKEKPTLEELAEAIQKIKAEAYKEFAEKAKESCCRDYEGEYVLYENDIDNLLKELVGEDNVD